MGDTKLSQGRSRRAGVASLPADGTINEARYHLHDLIEGELLFMNLLGTKLINVGHD